MEKRERRHNMTYLWLRIIATVLLGLNMFSWITLTGEEDGLLSLDIIFVIIVIWII